MPAVPVPDFAEINEKADLEDIVADTKASVMEKIKEQQEKVKTAQVPVPESKASWHHFCQYESVCEKGE